MSTAIKSNLSQIKKDIETRIGDNVQLISNAGRKKSIIKEGVLENTYANIFVVKLNDDAPVSRRVTYSYTDVFTNAVELFILKDDQKVKVS